MSLLGLAIATISGCGGAIDKQSSSTKEAIFSTLEDSKQKIQTEETPKEEETTPPASAKEKSEDSSTETPTVEEIEKANKECVKDSKGNVSKDYNIILQKEFTMKVIRYCAEKIGVPIELLVATQKLESGFILKAIGDHGKAIGLGQIHPSRFLHAKRNPRFAEIVAQFTDKPISGIKRSDSVLVDTLSIAIILKNCLNANKIEADHTTRLTADQIAMVRYYYHVPGFFKKYGKGKFFQGRKGRYYMYAKESLKVRELMDRLSTQAPQAKAD